MTPMVGHRWPDLLETSTGLAVGSAPKRNRLKAEFLRIPSDRSRGFWRNGRIGATWRPSCTKISNEPRPKKWAVANTSPHLLLARLFLKDSDLKAHVLFYIPIPSGAQFCSMVHACLSFFFSLSLSLSLSLPFW